MPIKDMKDEELWSAIEEANRNISTIVKYQAFVSTGSGKPRDDRARMELMESNIRLIHTFQDHIRDYLEELSRRHPQN